MNSKEHLEKLFDFNDWANRRIIQVLKSAESDRALKCFSHVLLTEREYYERLFGKDSTGFDFWRKLSIEECRRFAQENAQLYETLLKNFDDEGLGQVVQYYTSGGKAIKNSFREILSHIVLHSMNHRGQILTVLREEGFEPPSIDYIIYCREIA